jgi:pyruvate dehydrogenase E1 component beta subunit
VIDPRTLVPLDAQTLVDSVKKTGRCVIAHEAHRRSGPGAEIAAVIAEQALDWLDAPIQRVAAKNVPLPYAPALENFVLPGKEDIMEAVLKVMA